MDFIKDVRDHLRPVRRLCDLTGVKLREPAYRFKCAEPGSADWLIKAEVAYSGMVNGVARNKVSSLDARTANQPFYN